MNKEQLLLRATHTHFEQVELEQEHVIRVVKSGKFEQFDANTYVKLADDTFHNGTIEVKVRSRFLPDAPEFARGFIGIAFRIAETDGSFESFYVRPSNGETNDVIRKNRVFQYFAYPDYPFSYFRDSGINDFEGPATIKMDEWITLKAVIEDAKGTFYINDERVLVVEELKLGADTRGSVGIFVDTGTEGFFKELKVEKND